MKNWTNKLTLLLACVLLLQCFTPAFAAQMETEVEAEVFTEVPVETEVTQEPTEMEVTQEPTEAEVTEELPTDPEIVPEPADEVTEATEPETWEETESPAAEDATQAEEPEPVLPEAEAVPEETVTQQAALSVESEQAEQPEAVTEETEERLYNGLEADYDDPEFVKLLEQGFFDEDSGSSRAYASYKHSSVFKGYEITRGVDVSKWNNTVNWKKAKQDGIRFAIIRCGNRFSGDGHLGKDVLFDKNMKNATAAGLEVGVYFFSQAITEKEAIAEANYTLKLVKGYDFSLPIVFDFEYYGSGRLTRANLSRTQRTKICKAFCKTIEDAGYQAMVYANRDMLTKDMYGEQLPQAGYEVWLAEWNTSPKYTGTYTYWQYSDNGHVNGFDHQVDVNYRYRLPDATFTGIANTGKGIRLTWNKVAPADGYRIYRKVNDGSWSLLATISSNATVTYTDAKIVNGRRYTYSIQTYDGLIDGDFDEIGNTIVGSKVDGLTAAQVWYEGIRLKWKNNGKYSEYQILRRRHGTDEWKRIATVAGTKSSYTDKSRFTSGSTWDYTIVGVKNGTPDAYDTTGLSVYWLSPPALTGTVSKGTGILVEWSSVSKATAYRVYRKSADSGWTTLATVKELSYLDSSAKAGTEYTYTVRAVSGAHTSGYDGEGVTGKNLTTPKLDFASSRNGGREVVIGWNRVSGATGYRVYRRSSATEQWTALGSTTQTCFTDTNVVKGSTCFYTVKATGKLNGRSIVSGYHDTGIAARWLDMPVLNGLQVSQNSVTLRWKRVSGATSYIVYRKSGSSGWKKLATVSGAVSYVDKSPIKGRTATYTVRTVSGSSLSGYDKQGVSGLILNAPALKSAQRTASGVKLSWTAANGAQKYRIYRKDSGNANWKAIGWSKTTSFVDTSPATGVSCTYSVKAYATLDQKDVYSPYSNTKSLYVLSAPVLTSVSRTGTGAALAWQKVNGADSYLVYRKSSGGAWTELGSTTKLTYQDTVAAGSYTYGVKAVNGKKDVTSPLSNTKSLYVLPAPVLTSATRTENGATLAWQKVNGADSYRVYRKSNGGAWTELGSTTRLTYQDTGAAGSCTYGVKAVNGQKNVTSHLSNTKSLYVLPAPVLTDAAQTEAGAAIAWQSVDGADSYVVYRKSGEGDWTELGSTTELTYLDADAAGECTYGVKAVNGQKNVTSPLSNTMDVFMLSVPELTDAVWKETGAEISWTSVDGADSYLVYRKTGEEDWRVLGITAELTYLDDTADRVVSYVYTVCPVRGDTAGFGSQTGISLEAQYALM